MWNTLTTLFRGRAAETEERLIDANAVRLLEQKLREARSAQAHSKRTLAALIARLQAERREATGLEEAAADLEQRAGEALAAGREALALEAAEAIAERENALALKREAITRLESEMGRLRTLVEKTERRLAELRQGLLVAKSAEAARSARHRTLATVGTGTAALRDAEAMLERVLADSETEETAQALDEIERDLSGEAIKEKLEAEGFGPATKTRADDVLARLKAKVASDGATDQPSQA